MSRPTSGISYTTVRITKEDHARLTAASKRTRIHMAVLMSMALDRLDLDHLPTVEEMIEIVTRKGATE